MTLFDPTLEEMVARTQSLERRIRTMERREMPHSDYINIVDQKAQNTAGGAFNNGAWRTRDLNTELADTGNLASVAANQITLEAGTYRVFITAPAAQVRRHQLRLYDTTGAAVLLTGNNAFAVPGSQSIATLAGRFTISVQSVLEVQHQCQTTVAGNGFGIECNFTTEVYTNVSMWRE